MDDLQVRSIENKNKAVFNSFRKKRQQHWFGTNSINSSTFHFNFALIFYLNWIGNFLFTIEKFLQKIDGKMECGNLTSKVISKVHFLLVQL